MSVELTRRQSEILALIVERWVAAKPMPTRREIMDRFGFTSTNAATDHLKAIEKKGAIRCRALESRGIELVLDHPDVVALREAIEAARELG